MLSTILRQLMQHTAWADALVWQAVLRHHDAPADTHLRECLHHIHACQWAFLEVWRDEPLDLPEMSAFEDLHAMRAWGRRYHREVADYLDAMDAAALERHVELPWAQEVLQQHGSAHPATLAETIVQVASHSTYHRGQVNRRLRELGGEPPLTDFIAWNWMGRPVPSWEGGDAA